VLLLFFLIIRQRFVLKEEVQMQETFGDDYAQFKARIRRWI
jgi:protein-S-isoprenylcysteine O-methyltransferase Ste14